MQLALEDFLAKARSLNQAIKVDASANPHRLKQIHQVFSADIAGVTATVFHPGRVAANAAKRAVKKTHAGFGEVDVRPPRA